MRLIRCTLLALLVCPLEPLLERGRPGVSAVAEDIYQEPADFLAEVFSGEIPPVETISYTGARAAVASQILGHAPPGLRARYWLREQSSAWILEEIGKVKPITVGIVVKDGAVSDVRILIYRESHGSEVRHKYFTDQFVGATLKENHRLDRSIDGIAGATLSVNAVRRLASLALFLDKEARAK